MVNTYMEGEMDLRDLHQSSKATMIEDVRIPHSFKRKKTLFQRNLIKAERMLQMLDDLAEKAAKHKNRTERAQKSTPNKATQTDD